MSYQRGVFWGVVPYTPAAPFAVKFVTEYLEFATIGDLTREFRLQDIAGELPFSVRGKIRPVLALTEPSSELREITALKLANVSRRVRQRVLTPDEEAEIAAGGHPYLFPLPHAAVSALTRTRETYAAIVDNPISLHESAVTTAKVGEVTQDAFAELCAKLVFRLQLDLSAVPGLQPADADNAE